MGWSGSSLDEFHIELIERGILTELSMRAWGVNAVRPTVVVAVPATNEEATVGPALARLGEAFRFTRRAGGLVVFANNCTDLTAELAAIQRLGYAVDRQELNLGVWCVAAPILGVRQTRPAAVSVSAYRPELDAAEEERLATIAVQAALLCP